MNIEQGYIYHIKLKNNKHYIGKYSDTDIYRYHLERAAPLFLGYTASKKINSKSEA